MYHIELSDNMAKALWLKLMYKKNPVWTYLRDKLFIETGFTYKEVVDEKSTNLVPAARFPMKWRLWSLWMFARVFIKHSKDILDGTMLIGARKDDGFYEFSYRVYFPKAIDTEREVK